jgi:RNA polymerase-interacting CarD/CdnL/TRCF family regulator
MLINDNQYLSVIESIKTEISKAQYNAALHALPNAKVAVFATKKMPQLTAHYQDVLASCNILQYLTLLKEVALKEKIGAKKLSEIDIRFRNNTERLVCEELAVVLGKKPNEIKTIIHKLIG